VEQGVPLVEWTVPIHRPELRSFSHLLGKIPSAPHLGPHEEEPVQAQPLWLVGATAHNTFWPLFRPDSTCEPGDRWGLH